MVAVRVVRNDASAKRFFAAGLGNISSLKPPISRPGLRSCAIDRNEHPSRFRVGLYVDPTPRRFHPTFAAACQYRVRLVDFGLSLGDPSSYLRPRDSAFWIGPRSRSGTRRV